MSRVTEAAVEIERECDGEYEICNREQGLYALVSCTWAGVVEALREFDEVYWKCPQCGTQHREVVFDD